MIVTIIDGNLPDFIGNNQDGYITVKEPDFDKAFWLATIFSEYGKTVVIEHETEGE